MSVVSILDVARELLSWVDPDPGRLLVLACYFDDSGTHRDSAVVAFGGLVGQREHWEDFEPKWKAKLAAPLPGKPPLKRFHMVDCASRTGEFIGYTEAESDAVIHDFRQIILDSGVTGVCAGVERAPFEEFIGSVDGRATSADEMAFGSALSLLSDLKHHGLTLVFDDSGKEATARYAAMYDGYQKLFANRREPTLKGLAFRSMIDTLPLQGADMIAWETYCHMKDRLGDWSAKPRPHLQRYLDTDRFFAGLMRRGHILSLARKIRPAPRVFLDWWGMPWPPF